MDPLLSMLQNAAGRSAQPSQQLQSPPQQHSQNGPRPGSQTLDQLFASLTSPQSQTASLPSSHSAPNATSLNQGGRQAQLLGLLKGSASTPEPMGSVPPPGEAGNVIARAASPQEERAQQMLASLMGQLSMPGMGAPTAHPAPHTEPLIDHSSSPAQLPPVVTSPHPSELAAPSPPPSTQPSKFTFVSPFDAFDDVPAPPPPPPQKKAVTEPEKKTPAPSVTKMASRHQSPAPSAPSAPFKEKNKDVPTVGSAAQSAGLKTSTSTERASPRAEDLTPPPPLKTSTPVPTSVTSSPASTFAAPTKKSRKGAEEMPMPYKAAQYVHAGQGNLIKTLTEKHIIFDVSKPNVDSLAHEEVLTERKISAVKTDVMSTGLTKRRGLAISKTMVAYLLSKGGARILDQSTGLNTMITVEERGQIRKIIDIGVVDGGWAAGVLDDHSFCIWKIDTGVDALKVTLIAKVFDTKSYGPVQRVHWRQPTFFKEKYLIDDYGMLLATDKYVLAVGPEDYGHEDEEDEYARAAGMYGEGINKGIAVLEYGVPQKAVIDINLNDEADLLAILQEGGVISMYMGVSRKGGWTLQLPSTSRPTGAQTATAITAIDVSRVLVEFDNGTSFALVDKTGQSLGSITFKIPADGQRPSDIRLAAARYDNDNDVVWISHFLRASLFALRLADAGSSTAFECITEIPLEPLGDFALSSRSLTGNDDLEIFYKFPRGFSQTTLDHEFFKKIVEKSGSESVAVQEETAQPVEEVNGLPARDEQDVMNPHAEKEMASPEVQHQTREFTALEQPFSQTQQTISTRDLREEKTAIEQPSVPAEVPSTGGAITSNTSTSNTSEITAAIKKGEERMNDKFNKALHRELGKHAEKQNAHVDSLFRTFRSQDTEMHQQLTTSLEGALQQAVQVEFDKSALPNMEAIIRKAVSDIVAKQIVSSIEREINTSVAQQVERVLAPELSRAISATITPLVENEMQLAIQQVVAPQLATAVQAISSDLGRSVKVEMLNIRKAIAQEHKTEALQSQQTMQAMAASISTLLDQVQALSAQIQSLHSARAPQSPPSAEPSRSTSKDIPHPPFNGGAPPAHTEKMEDTFLAAFANMNNEQLTEFVCERYGDTLMYLPNPGEESPLSQAVLLTMIHRLSSCLRGNETGTKGFQACLSWVFRALRLVDRQDPAMTPYIGPIFSAVRAHLLETIRTANIAPDAAAGHAVAAREIIGQVLTILG